MEFMSELVYYMPLCLIEIAVLKEAIKFENAYSYKLEKEENYKEAFINYNSDVFSIILKDYIPKKINYELKNINDETIKKIILNRNKNEELNPLIHKLTNHIEPKYLASLLLNIGDLKIKYIKNFQNTSLLSGKLGSYDSNNNIIEIYKDKDGTLPHEFLHASTKREIKEKNCMLVGFEMYNDYFDWFVGLNEGYTEVLCKRIFNKRKTSYPTNYYMCKYIETLFDNPKKMEIAYFLNNIDAVIDKFLEYGTKEEFIEINKVLDYSQKYIFLDDDKLKSTFDLLHDIIKRTNDENKIKKCEMIDAERKPSVKKLVRKIFN